VLALVMAMVMALVIEGVIGTPLVTASHKTRKSLERSKRTDNHLKRIEDVYYVPCATVSTKNAAALRRIRALSRTGVYGAAWSGHHAHVPTKNAAK
jgi:hypothetical protein